MRQIVLDTETTGMPVSEGHRIIEIGCLEMVNRKLTGRQFHYYLNPGREIDPGAIAVHGIQNDFLKDKPIFSHIAHEFLDFIKEAELIIHNAPFDVGFINHEFLLMHKEWKSLSEYCQIVDTLFLARRRHVGQRNTLDALCKRYHVDHSKREFHGALLDTYLLAQVFLAMTGGQSSLFESLSNDSSLEAEKSVQSMNHHLKTHNLLVVKASPEELDEHNQYLKQMKEKGKCLWMRE